MIVSTSPPNRLTRRALPGLLLFAGKLAACAPGAEGGPFRSTTQPLDTARMTPPAWPASAEIRAARRWNATGIRVEAGQAYDLAATGRWMDLNLCAGPAGNPHPTWSQRLVACRLRAPDALYFTLIGALDRDPSTQFPIGACRSWTAPRAGELTCFANDVPLMYWNNRGSVHLTVTPRA
jgi:hypothetical protein